MKLIGILIILVATFYFVVYPPVSQEKLCYDSSQKNLSDIGYFSASRGWNQAEICQKRTDVLLELGDCIEKVKLSSIATKYANSLVEGVLPLVRPSAKGYVTLKNEHNAECADYTTYQLE